MIMAKINETSLVRFALAYFYAAIRAFRARMAEVETTLQRFHTLLGELNTLWTAFDEAYKRSTKSQLTEEIARLDTERDHCAAVIKEVAKLWANHFKDVDETLAVKGRRVLQPFVDFDFSTHESMVAENSKIENIEQVLSTAQLQADLQAMGLTAINQMLATKTAQLVQLIDQRSQEMSGIEKGELRAAREALYAKYLELTEYINAVQVIQPEEALGQAAQYYNADLKKIEEQTAQGGSQPSVLVKSAVVGNHRYTVPEFSKWEDIVAANDKAFAVDAATDRIVSLSAKAKKVGGLFLALNGVAVKPSDAVDAKKEYDLVEISGGSSDVTPVTPE